jgi:hypothetical protein
MHEKLITIVIAVVNGKICFSFIFCKTLFIRQKINKLFTDCAVKSDLLEEARQFIDPCGT